jgi:hypothetical protein
MQAFLKLFVICAFAGFFAASLMWLFFWTVGVFDVPLELKRLFKPALSSDYLLERNLAQAMLRVELQRQVGMSARLQYVLASKSLCFDSQQVSSSISQESELGTDPEKENAKGFYAAAGY